MPVSATHKGWYWDRENSRLELYYEGTKVAHLTSSGLTFTAGAGLTLTDTGLTVTAGGATVAAGNLIVTAGDSRITAGNLRLGAISTFATTEPTSAVVMKQGTAPAGAIATSGGLFSSATVVQKIIAAGTVSNVET